MLSATLRPPRGAHGADISMLQLVDQQWYPIRLKDLFSDSWKLDYLLSCAKKLHNIKQ